MELLVALIAGILIAAIATRKPITIKIQHEQIFPESTEDPYAQPDKKEEHFYEDLNKTLDNIANVMGGGNNEKS
jgi:hypothetical protein